jgi:hypothetical protein
MRTWQTNANEKKDWVMSNVSSVVEILLQITRDVWSTRVYKENIPTSLFQNIHSSSSTQIWQLDHSGGLYLTHDWQKHNNDECMPLTCSIFYGLWPAFELPGMRIKWMNEWMTWIIEFCVKIKFIPENWFSTGPTINIPYNYMTQTCF